MEWISEVRPKSNAWEFIANLGAMYVRDLMEEKSIFPILIQPQEKVKLYFLMVPDLPSWDF